MSTNLRRRLIDLGGWIVAAAVIAYIVSYLIAQDFQYDFIDLPFASDIGGGFVRINSSDFIWVAALKGVANTVLLVGVSIVLASMLGLAVGTARLSKNPLLSGFGRLYVETVRNVPLLVMMFVFAFVVFAGLPPVDARMGLPGTVYVSNRGLAVPEFNARTGTWPLWLGIVLLASAGAVYAARVLRTREEESGKVLHGRVIAFAGWFVVVVLAYFALGRPVVLVGPAIETESLFPSYTSGRILSLGYAAAVSALTLYFGAFIAEIVRGSIQAIPRQQSEAAASLGFTPGQRFFLIILPQALRIMIPSLNNEYQNANKDSSLAHLITYSEIVFIAIQVANNRGNMIELFLGVFLVYVTLNLLISTVMNLLNRSVQVIS